MYPDSRISDFINQNFIPVKIHIKENPQSFERFGAQWTPTVIIASPARVLFRAVEPRIRAHGFGDIVDDWEPKVGFLRGE